MKRHTSNRHPSKMITELLAQAKRTLRGGATEGHDPTPQTIASMIATGKITREMSCDTKARFRTYEYAENEVRPALERKHGKRLRVYPCVFCNGWHLCTVDEFAA